MRQHDTSDETGADCWCGPSVEQTCPELVERKEDDASITNCLPDCWRCRGSGSVPQYDEELPRLVIHRREPD